VDDVRFEALFRDLEAQADALEQRELRGRAEDLTWSVRAGIGLRDRLRAHTGAPLRVILRDGTALDGRVGGLGREWFVLGSREDGGRYVLVPFAAVRSFDGLTVRADTAAGVLEDRLSLTVALRTVARDRAMVRILVPGGSQTGLIAGLGADHLDLRSSPTSERAPLHARTITMPLESLLAVVVG
jgi:hypothetical protein